MRNIFSNDYKFVVGNADCQTALSNNTAYPASGSFIDVSGYEWVNVVIAAGDYADTIAYTLKQTNATNGSLVTIDATNCKKTVATADAGQVINFYLETNQLTTDYHFITTYVSGVSGSNYATITYLLGGARHQPVSQASTVMPSDNILIKAG